MMRTALRCASISPKCAQPAQDSIGCQADRDPALLADAVIVIEPRQRERITEYCHASSKGDYPELDLLPKSFYRWLRKAGALVLVWISPLSGMMNAEAAGLEVETPYIVELATPPKSVVVGDISVKPDACSAFCDCLRLAHRNDAIEVANESGRTLSAHKDVVNRHGQNSSGVFDSRERKLRLDCEVMTDFLEQRRCSSMIYEGVFDLWRRIEMGVIHFWRVNILGYASKSADEALCGSGINNNINAGSFGIDNSLSIEFGGISRISGNPDLPLAGIPELVSGFTQANGRLPQKPSEYGDGSSK